MIDYTDEYPETDWTTGHVMCEHAIPMDLYGTTSIPADSDPLTVASVVDVFAKSFAPLDTSDVEHLVTTTKKKLPKNAVAKTIELWYAEVGCYDEEPRPQVNCRIWYYVPKTPAQKRNFLKDQELRAKRELAAKAREKALEEEKEKKERKLFEKLKKKYG